MNKHLENALWGKYFTKELLNVVVWKKFNSLDKKWKTFSSVNDGNIDQFLFENFWNKGGGRL